MEADRSERLRAPGMLVQVTRGGGRALLAEARGTICDFDGHAWGDAGGGLLICVRCQAEKWSSGAARRPCSRARCGEVVVADHPELGLLATVVMDHETHGPTTLRDDRRGLRDVTLLPGRDDDHFSEEGYQALKAANVDNMVLPLDSTRMELPLVDEIPVVSTYSLHRTMDRVGQGAAGAVVEQALYLIGTSGDCDEHVDNDTLLPLAVPEPPGWEPTRG